MTEERKAKWFWKKHDLLMKLGFKHKMIGRYSGALCAKIQEDKKRRGFIS